MAISGVRPGGHASSVTFRAYSLLMLLSITQSCHFWAGRPRPGGRPSPTGRLASQSAQEAQVHHDAASSSRACGDSPLG